VSDLVSFFVTDGVISAKNVDSRDDGASESVFKTNDQCQRYVVTGCEVFSSVSSIRWQDSKVDGYFDLSTIDFAPIAIASVARIAANLIILAR